MYPVRREDGICESLPYSEMVENIQFSIVCQRVLGFEYAHGVPKISRTVSSPTFATVPFPTTRKKHDFQINPGPKGLKGSGIKSRFRPVYVLQKYPKSFTFTPSKIAKSGIAKRRHQPLLYRWG
jgi:hypothetical protein